jgi:hypothetical protein
MEVPSFSYKWLILSMITFVGIELVLGGVVGAWVAGRYLSHSLLFVLQGVLNLAGYFLGGLLIGAVSPGLRMREPAIAAFCSVALMLGLTLFTPYAFIQFSLTKLVIGGVIACFLAYVGAELGEKLTGNRLA